jgi:hypothetical protein
MVKRLVLIALLTFGMAAALAAQGWGRWGFSGPRVPAAEKTTVTGNLTIARGSPALISGDVTYLIPGLLRYAGFIDSLKDGVPVKIEGFAAASPRDSGVKFLRPEKLTVGGKDYDLSHPALPEPAPMWPRGRMPRGGRH